MEWVACCALKPLSNGETIRNWEWFFVLQKLKKMKMNKKMKQMPKFTEPWPADLQYWENQQTSHILISRGALLQRPLCCKGDFDQLVVEFQKGNDVSNDRGEPAASVLWTSENQEKPVKLWWDQKSIGER
jgi:hypothetical protein